MILPRKRSKQDLERLNAEFLRRHRAYLQGWLEDRKHPEPKTESESDLLSATAWEGEPTAR